MANITQTIPALTAGISQQPDEYKIPGQVKDMVNAIPDVSQGLLKRPAGKFVASLSDGTKNSSADGKWFHYYRDEAEQYIGQIHKNGTVRIWDCLTGAEKNVVDGIGNTTYLTHTDDEDIQTLTLNDFTYLNNRSIKTEMDTLTEPLGDFGKEIFVELKSISYAKQYALNVFDNTTTQPVSTATRINVELIGSSNNYGTTAGYLTPHSLRDNYTTYNDIESNGDDLFNPTDKSAGDGRDAYAPNVGTRIFDITDDKILIDENAIGGITYNNNNPKEIGSITYNSGVTETDENGNSVNMESKGDNFKYSINVINASGQNVSTQTNRTRANNLQPKNLYFRIATTGQSVPFSEGSGTSQETKYKARYTTTFDLLHGGEGWETGDYFFVWMKDGYYKVTVEATSTSVIQANLALVRPNPTPFDTETTITAESILGSIREGITGSATASTGNGFTVTQIGTGLHIKRSTNFNASTPVGELLNVVAGKVNDVGDLPSQCKDGMVVEVVNSVADEDNHFVKFFGNSGRDGEGTWEECAKPGRTIRLKRSKMPVVLIRTADGNFRITELDGSAYTVTTADGPVTANAPQWDDAICGDDVTNPEPSFVGKTINKMVFFRNRFCILSDEYIVLSRPGDFTNFFAKSAIVQIASDPIDISASSEYPAILYDGIQVNTGLVLFSKNQQFMLTTDSDAFTPLTAKINALSTYNFNFATNPISLGTTIGFLDNAGKFSRFFEMVNVQREGEPQLIEQSAVVSRLFEKDLKLISNSRENSVIFFSEEGSSTLYGYRYFDQVTERKLAAWFKWTLTGTIQYHCMQDDFLYVVVRNGSNNKDQLLKFAIKIDTNTPTVEEHRVHLDHLMKIEHTGSNAVTVTYNSSLNESTFTKPTGLESTNQLAAFDIDSGAQLGRYSLITRDGNTLKIAGDWSSQTFMIGYLYTMEVAIPTIYYVRREGEAFRADTRAHTILHRVKFGFGPIGVYETTLKRIGRVDYTETFEIAAADAYIANTAGIVNDDNLRTVPIYDRNINAQLTIKSTHPTPATIHNMTWEGVYTNNNYERV